MSCEKCTDPDGEACFPVYGLGPHKHVGESFIGSTVMLEQNGVDGLRLILTCPEWEFGGVHIAAMESQRLRGNDGKLSICIRTCGTDRVQAKPKSGDEGVA